MEKVLSGGLKVCLTGPGSHPAGICGGTGFGSGMALGLILAKREGQDGGIGALLLLDPSARFKVVSFPGAKAILGE